MDRPRWYGFNHNGREVVLDLGCGLGKVPGSIGVDMNVHASADVVHNLDEVPYPFQDDSIDAIYLNHCIEHLIDPEKTLRECLRIAKPGAAIYITMPHFTNAASFGDVTHRRYFSYRALPTLAKEVKLNGKALVLARMKISARIFLFTPLINLAPRLWEDYFCFILTGRALFYQLRVVTSADTYNLQPQTG